MRSMLHGECSVLLMRLALATFAFGVAAKPAKPHIIFHVIDDFGWDDPGFRNHQIHTPALDMFHQQGITLDQYYVQPSCSPSRATFMSGRMPLHTGINDWIPNKAYGLPLDETTLPQLLGSAGYKCHAVGKWHLGFFRTEYTPTFRGFESFYGFYEGSEDYFKHTKDGGFDLHREAQPRCGPGCTTLAWEDTDQYSTNLFADEALRIIDRHNTSEPLFLYQAWQGVHDPRQVPQHYVEPYVHRIPDLKRREFAGMVSAVDEGIGNITRKLQEKGMLADAVVIVTTDNGGPIVDCAGIGASNLPLRGGKCSLWEGGTRGTSLLFAPGYVERSFTWQGLMHGADWLPTLVEGVADERIWATKPLDGMNVWPQLIGNRSSPRQELYYGLADSQVGHHGPALREGPWKLIVGTGGGSGDHPHWWRNFSSSLGLSEDHRPRLFNVQEDPSERCEVSDQEERVRSMLSKIHGYQATAVPQRQGDPRCPPFAPLRSPQGPYLGPWCDDAQQEVVV
ncbi:unnamed protein product [Durusdinium trenchii]|uniref:Sulfatase N-terminal domain-containing protein n=1 Tax=Durusdinium trenchii TaxID=1381693 RepID=A0ABP0HV38_9DINO